MYMKEHGRHFLDNHNYKDIHMPNNTHTGVFMGIFMLVGGFFLIQQMYHSHSNLE
jgi:cytochrome aa3-600 menaquinol oxidase subunit 1